jgi:hypothetical protein
MSKVSIEESDNESNISDDSNLSDESDLVLNNKQNSESENESESDSENVNSNAVSSNVVIKQASSSSNIIREPLNEDKRKSKKEHVHIIKSKILSLIEEEKKLSKDILNIENSLITKKKEYNKLLEEKNKLINSLFNKMPQFNDSKTETKQKKEVSSGFNKLLPVPDTLRKFLKIEDNIKELNLVNISSLIIKKFKEEKLTEGKYYIFNTKTLKILKLDINNIKSKLNDKASENIKIETECIKVPAPYIKTIIKLLYN